MSVLGIRIGSDLDVIFRFLSDGGLYSPWASQRLHARRQRKAIMHGLWVMLNDYNNLHKTQQDGHMGTFLENASEIHILDPNDMVY